MVNLLIVYHSQGGNTRKMAEAAAAGASEIEGVQVRLQVALETAGEDLMACDGLLIGSPEYFGYMAGALKDLFDRTYEPLRGLPRIFRKPYAVFISAGNDGSGALLHIERICTGFQFKKVQPPVISKGSLTEAVLDQCRELGRTLAAGCEAGVY
jgi:multimeric flavodoxin WrbA